VLSWLARLFGQRVPAETASAAAPPLETPPPAAAVPTQSDALAAVVDPSAQAPALLELPTTTATEEGKETCPVCGRTSVFAGPPGQRFCTYCALRDELFERSAAATE
jgi:hypothetical protein